MNIEQDRLYRERRILEEVRPLGSKRSIYYGHVPPARDRQLSEGCPRAPLRASRSDRNNIPYSVLICKKFLYLGLLPLLLKVFLIIYLG